MLKITKGLTPYIIKDTTDNISTYTDATGNMYVRVTDDDEDEDFCIAAHDYVKDGEKRFTWNDAMKVLKDDGLTTLNEKQAKLYIKYQNEINDELRKIGGEPFKKEAYYWTIAPDITGNYKWAYCLNIKWGKSISNTISLGRDNHFRVRPIINL